MKNNELNNFEIIEILKHFGIEINGIYSKNNLPLELKRGFYIINLDDKNGEGTHWTTFYYNYPDYSIYYDSYGFIAPEMVQNKIKPYIFNDKEIHSINSSSC